MPEQAAASPVPDRSRPSSALAKVMSAAHAVADANPAEIEAAARQLGESRRYLAPLAWAAGRWCCWSAGSSCFS
jgi:hypothetical protein